MPRNVEIKVRVRDLERLRARVRERAGERRAVLEQEDVFFSVPHGRLKLRFLPAGAAELIHYERADQTGPKLSQYRLARTEEPEALRALLAGALGEIGVVRKRRELHLAGRTRIHLDEVEGLGAFLELEVVLAPEEPAAHGEAVALALMEELGVDAGDLVADAYVDLLEARGAAGPSGEERRHRDSSPPAG